MEREQHKASLATAKELNQKLQEELEEAGKRIGQLRETVQKTEEQMVQRGSQISETRRRLFDEKSTVAKLREEVQKHVAAEGRAQAKLEEERCRTAEKEKDLLRLQHVFDTTSSLRAAGGASRAAGRSSSVPYGRSPALLGGSAEESLRRRPEAKVSDCDELAASRPSTATTVLKSALKRSGPRPGLLGGEAKPPPLMSRFCRSSAEAWDRTPVLQKASDALVARVPAASTACAREANSNSRRLLSEQEGPLYTDENVSVHLMFLGTSKRGHLQCSFELALENRCRFALQQLKVAPSAGPSAGNRQASATQPFTMSISQGAASVQPSQTIRLTGRLELLTPFDEGPCVEISYLLVDNLCCRACLRLPIAVTRFMSPVKLPALRFFEVWNSGEFARNEVSFVCSVRQEFLGAGGFFLYAKSLEVGGVLNQLPGLDETSQGLVLACTYPHQGSDVLEFVLVHAELGIPRDAALCRVTLRSMSYIINRGLANVLLALVAGE